MNKIIPILLAVLLLGCPDSFAQRKSLDFNDGWNLRPTLHTGSRTPPSVPVTLPHTWNAADVLETRDYLRTTMLYFKDFSLDETEIAGKRVFLYFEGVNSVATVFVNRKFSGEHHGGYTAFCVEITDNVVAGDNSVEVMVSNAFRTDVAPVTGDFNVFGGIHRPVHLLITGRDCISPLDYASPGVYVVQKNVSGELADLEVLTKLSLPGGRKNLSVRAEMFDASGKSVGETVSSVPSDATEVRQRLRLPSPVLWEGKANPHLYTVTASLLDGSELLDKVTVKTGLRYFSVTPDRGFFLNGRHLDLYGFGKHEDMEGRGSAMLREDYLRDFSIIEESGATSVRLTHYPHAEIAYDICDSLGLVVWTEIPNVGPGGFLGSGYYPMAEFKEHLRTVLKEMIRQKFNHPSVCFWGLSNELNFNYDDPRDFSSELNCLAHREDPSRLTACATFIKENVLDEAAELTAYNKYFGWYEGQPSDLGQFLEDVHASHRYIPIAVSEYGAGGSPLHHDLPQNRPVHESHWHPEEYQAFCHEQNWKEMSSRTFVWGKYIWNFADFSSSVKDEGDRRGINDKGLVTYDRSVRKDAFWFYKANWNPEPMVYITSRRWTERQSEVTDIKVYTNMDEAWLYVNGVQLGKARSDSYRRAVWEGVRLSPGKNEIRVVGKSGRMSLEDSCIWNVTK